MCDGISGIVILSWNIKIAESTARKENTFHQFYLYFILSPMENKSIFRFGCRCQNPLLPLTRGWREGWGVGRSIGTIGAIVKGCGGPQ